MKLFTSLLILATSFYSTYGQFNLKIDGVEVPASHEFECFVSPRTLTISHNEYDSLSFAGSKIKYYEYAEKEFVEKAFTEDDININSTGVIKPAFAIRREPLVISLNTVMGYKNGYASKVKLATRTIKIHFKTIGLQDDREYARVNNSSKIGLKINKETIEGPNLGLAIGDRLDIELPQKHKLVSGEIQFMTAPENGEARPIGGPLSFHTEADLNYIFRNKIERMSSKMDYAVMINIQYKNNNGIIPLKESLFYKLSHKKNRK